MIYNNEKLNLKVYDESKIRRNSEVLNYQWSQGSPMFILSTVHKDVLEDRSSWVHLGEADTDYYKSYKIND